VRNYVADYLLPQLFAVPAGGLLEIGRSQRNKLRHALLDVISARLVVITFSRNLQCQQPRFRFSEPVFSAPWEVTEFVCLATSPSDPARRHPQSRNNQIQGSRYIANFGQLGRQIYCDCRLWMTEIMTKIEANMLAYYERCYKVRVQIIF